MKLIKLFGQRYLIIGGIFALLLFSFQNCSQNYGLGLDGSGSSSQKAAGGDPIIGANTDGCCQSGDPDQPGSDDDGVEDKDPNYSHDCGDDSDENDYRAICNKLIKKSLIQVVDGFSLTGNSGYIGIKGDKIGLILNKSGALRVLGTSDSSSIDEIRNSSGTRILCGISVKKLTNVSGNTIVVDGDVGEVSNHSGTLRVLGGQITGAISGSNGNIRGN